ncbi:uncharacterized protein LOC113235992 isoform X2 [Hyposmocoma kahamanoa]|uniref:uncharacterized protein LOC113235992 isoform X2 n=1 Tax=Hyposmocoma kahamanoa TaxID=1477025 RepID=UPI000E6D7AFB|nr:uncharacterized protein LOC113235992 isoform X2 [Hyposmocoma kahamanoa]
MMKCQLRVAYIVVYLCVNVRCTPGLSLLGGKSVINIISGTKVQLTTSKVPENLTTEPTEYSTLSALEDDQILSSVDTRLDNLSSKYDNPDAPDRLHPVLHAGLPQNMTVTPLRRISHHELVLNVSWLPPFGRPAREYSILVDSTTRTKDCIMRPWHKYDIPSNVTSFLIPPVSSTVAGDFTTRPGCAYEVRLRSNPWDGHTTAHKYIQLDGNKITR